ncbi:MAG: NAD(P)H-dependent oxidoreductase [archaeon]|nr:NAD(P)H-dependent oxidoreductase [archaeon]
MNQLNKSVNYLKKKKKILFITTSNRWSGDKELPKSSLLAHKLAESVGKDKVTILDVSSLNIFHCEGNISRKAGNNCGVIGATLKNKNKNPTGNHRCWASINNKDDDLWKVSKELFQSDCVLFFSSVRWGQLNAHYQKLIERLSWIENRHSTLKEKNVVGDVDVGLIVIGQNWRGKEILRTQKEVLGFYGFNVVNDLCWNWQFTTNLEDESKKSYKEAFTVFSKYVLSGLKNR